MTEFLTKYQSLIPVVQKIILNRTKQVDAAAQVPLSSYEPTTRVVEQHGRSNPHTYNTFQGQLYTDLAAAYAEIQAVEQFSNKTESLYKRAVQYLRDGVTRLRRKLIKYRHLINLGNGTTDIFYEDFVDAGNKEMRRLFYENAPATDAVVDKDSETLILPKVGELSRIRSAIKKNRVARFELDEKLGARQGDVAADDTSHDTSMAIDKNRDTFWAEVIVSDEPITIKPTWWSIEIREVRITVGDGTTGEEWLIQGLCPVVSGVHMWPIKGDGTPARDWIYSAVLTRNFDHLAGNLLTQIDQGIGFNAQAAGEKNPVTAQTFLNVLSQNVREDQYGQRHVTLADLKTALQDEFTTVFFEVTTVDEPLETIYPVRDGAASKTHIMLQHKASANRLSLKPFMHGAMDLVALYTIPYDSEELAISRGEANFIILDPQKMKPNTVIHFDRHDIKRVYMVFNQRNYVRNIYQVPRSQLFNIELRDRLSREEYRFTTDLLSVKDSFQITADAGVTGQEGRNKALSQRKVDELTGWYLLVEYAQRLRTKMLEGQYSSQKDKPIDTILNAMGLVLADKGLRVKTLAEADSGLAADEQITLEELERIGSEKVEMQVFEYVYGLYDVDLDDVYYNPDGTFITKPFSVSGRAAGFTAQWDSDEPPGTSVRAFLSYDHNNTAPQWRSVDNGQFLEVFWPDNSDLQNENEQHAGGIGRTIALNKVAYVHPCARTDRMMIRSGVPPSGMLTPGQEVHIKGQLLVQQKTGSAAYWRIMSDLQDWEVTLTVNTAVDFGVDTSNGWTDVLTSPVQVSQISIDSIKSIAGYEGAGIAAIKKFLSDGSGLRTFRMGEMIPYSDVNASDVRWIKIDEVKVRDVGSIVQFNHAKGTIGSNRAYEPNEGEAVVGYQPQAAIWPFGNGAGGPSSRPSDEVNETLRVISNLPEQNFPMVIRGGTNLEAGGMTSDETSTFQFVVDVLAYPDVRIYYRPITVTIIDGANTYLPDPYGEPYFIEDNEFTLNISTPKLMKSTVSGTVLGEAIRGNVTGQWLVPIETSSGNRRDLPLWELSYYVSDSDFVHRIVKWDPRTELYNSEDGYSIMYAGTKYQLPDFPKSGVIILGIKHWVDQEGFAMTVFAEDTPTEQNVKAFAETKVFNGDQCDILYPIVTEERDFQTGEAPPKINIKFEAGIINGIAGWTSAEGNTYPYVGYLAVRLDHFVDKQPVYPNLGVITRNVTNYKKLNRRPTMRRWDLDPESPNYYPVIEYYHDVTRNRIEFARQLPTEWVANISYATYAPDVRMKFQLEGDLDVSPIIDNFRIEVKEV